MKSQETIPVQIKSVRNNVSPGTVDLEVWDKKARTARALKGLGITWGLAVAAVLIPLLHFILVPSLLIAGPIIFFWLVGQEEIILGGHGDCPECKKDFKIVRAPVKWPLRDLCGHCRSELTIERTEAVSFDAKSV